jgi:hypothetical protein
MKLNETFAGDAIDASMAGSFFIFMGTYMEHYEDLEG